MSEQKKTIEEITLEREMITIECDRQNIVGNKIANKLEVVEACRRNIDCLCKVGISDKIDMSTDIRFYKELMKELTTQAKELTA